MRGCVNWYINNKRLFFNCLSCTLITKDYVLRYICIYNIARKGGFNYLLIFIITCPCGLDFPIMPTGGNYIQWNAAFTGKSISRWQLSNCTGSSLNLRLNTKLIKEFIRGSSHKRLTDWALRWINLLSFLTFLVFKLPHYWENWQQQTPII